MKTQTFPLRSLVGRQIGWLRVNSPVVNLNRNFETAAWWQEETSATGVFPLILTEDIWNKGKFYALATLPGKVTDANFASLWCGTPIGRYDKSRDVGREVSMSYRVELPELVKTTGGHYPDKLPQVKFAPIWEHVPVIIAQWRETGLYWLNCAWEVSRSEWSHMESTGYGNYAIWAGEYAKQAEEMTRELSYMTEKGDSWRDLFARNFAWIPKA